MILVLLGTQNNSFHRLLEKLEECITNQIITDTVIVQSGHTKFQSDKMQITDFFSKQVLEDLLHKADLIITHGGVGSIVSGVKLGKKVIGVPRLKKYGEHVSDHQIQIVENFNENNYIKGCFDLNDLPNILKDINSFSPLPYVSNTENILKIVSDFIGK